MSNRHISFVGLGRIRDQALLAGAFDRLSTYEKNSIEANFQTCLSEAVSRCSPGSRQKRVFKEGTCLYVLADNDLCCLYVVACKTAEFPERHAFALLSEVVRMVTEHDEHGGDVPRYLNNLPVGGLTKPLRRALKDVMDRFDDPVKFDRTAEVQAKVESTKEVMEDNLKKIMESHANIRTLQDKTDNLATSASQVYSYVCHLHLYSHSFCLTLTVISSQCYVCYYASSRCTVLCMLVCMVLAYTLC
eukprot:GHVQ01003251.1.p1 GENE.GHVQ01003251.1~~GHVQ01003251.1.p1  ORF type:complete len:246 (-),score=28.64 GHVQ01003251.1:75-812(-)